MVQLPVAGTAQEPVRLRMPADVVRPVVEAAAPPVERSRRDVRELELVGGSTTRLARKAFARSSTIRNETGAHPSPEAIGPVHRCTFA